MMKTFSIRLKSKTHSLTLWIVAESENAIHGFLTKARLHNVCESIEETGVSDVSPGIDLRLNSDGSVKSISPDWDLALFISSLAQIITEDVMLS